MFIVFLRFGENRSSAAQFMEAHRDWIRQGFDSGIFLLVGSLEPGFGGAIVAHNTTLAELEDRVALDPFVREAVVSAEIAEISPSMADERLSFLIP